MEPANRENLYQRPGNQRPRRNSVAGGVAVIDPVGMKVEKIFNVSHDSCSGPQGMAIEPGGQILLGCNGASGDGNIRR